MPYWPQRNKLEPPGLAGWFRLLVPSTSIIFNCAGLFIAEGLKIHLIDNDDLSKSGNSSVVVTTHGFMKTATRIWTERE